MKTINVSNVETKKAIRVASVNAEVLAKAVDAALNDESANLEASANNAIINKAIASVEEDNATSVIPSVDYTAINAPIASVEYAYKLSALHSVAENMVDWTMKNYFTTAGVDFTDVNGEYYIRYFVTINPNSNGKRTAYAWISKEMVWCKEQNAFAYEINICPEFLNRPFEELFVSICHELVHLYNIKKGNEDTSRNGQYHNDKFMDACDIFQIKVEKDKKYGWSTNIVPIDKQSLKVQAMSKAFVNAFKEHLDMFKLTRKANCAESAPKAKAKKAKTYLSCGCTTREIKLKKGQDIPTWKCSACGNELRLVEDSAPSEMAETESIGKEILQAEQEQPTPTEEKKAEEVKAPEAKAESKVEESAPKVKKASGKAKAPKASAPKKTNTKKSAPKKAEASVEESAPIVAETKALVTTEESVPCYLADDEKLVASLAADVVPFVAPARNANGTVNVADVDAKIMQMMLEAEANN